MSSSNHFTSHSPRKWSSLLTSYISSNPQITSKSTSKSEITNDFISILCSSPSSSSSQIPRFFYKKPTSNSELYLSVRNEANQKFLLTKKNLLPNHKDIKDLYTLLLRNISPPNDSTQRINYRDFKLVGSSSPLFSSYFKATTFLKFDRDKYGRIEILSLLSYIARRHSAEEAKISLSLCDFSCNGYLNDKGLDTYIKKEFTSFPFYGEIADDIKEYYLLVAQRKFFFFLDPKRTGKISINDIVTSPILSEFLSMKEKSRMSQSSYGQWNGNWFTLENFWRIYRKYVDLDRDKNGMLSREELIKFSPGLTGIFIDRVFEEYQKYENAIDFKQFIDFVLAMENKKEPGSIMFIWKAVDVYHKNAVDTFVINMFFRAVVKKLVNRDKGEYRIDDVKDEIWDMIKPKNKNYFTLQDVLNSPYGEIVLSFLIDAKAFYQHDQKEFPYIEEFVEMDEEY